MTSLKISHLFFFLIFAHTTNAYKYLFISMNVGYSHLAFDGGLADTLVEAGHQVDFLINRGNTFINGNGSRLANVTHYTPKNIDKLNQITMTIPFYDDLFQNDIDLFTTDTLKIFAKMMSIGCYDILSDTQLLDHLRAQKYDGAFSEMLDACSLILFRKVGIKNVMITCPTALPEMVHDFGLPTLSSFVPNLNKAPTFPLHMNFMERLVNFYYNTRSNYVAIPMLQEAFEAPGNLRGRVYPLDFPTISQLKHDSTGYFVNSNEIVDLPRPYAPLIHKIGGIGIKEEVGQLSESLQKIFQIARKGVVLFSFGSIVDTTKMNTNVRNAFLDAFSEFPDYEFIWKYVGPVEQQEKVFKNYTNVHPFDWLDQMAILANPKTRLFISHVGLNSLNEAAYSAVPLLAIPFFGDQTYNRAIVEHLKIGKSLSKSNLSKEKLVSAISDLLKEEGNEYKTKSLTIQKMLRAQPLSAKQKFVHIVEYTTQFGDELKARKIPQLSSFVYFSIDVITFLVSTTIFSIFICIWVIKKFFQKFLTLIGGSFEEVKEKTT